MQLSMFRALLPTFMLAAIAACTQPPDSAFANRGGPEYLLDVSSEVVNLSVADQIKLEELVRWIEKDQPTRAELYCTVGEARCEDARKVLELNAVPLMVVPSREYNVALVYERILARDCNHRFVDNTDQMYNESHPAFGCSIAANIVQQVSNKQEFLAPNVMDLPDATAATNVYRRANTPRQTPTRAYSVGDPLTAKAKSN